MLLIYVDNILIIGNDLRLIDETMTKLNSSFALKYLGDIHQFLGFEVHKDISLDSKVIYRELTGENKDANL